ncbi:MAG: hypothetical protein IPK04_23245 [Bdellovibrionales bacterium]|nr:hypothetical protein [Bdellovibrionales bacterium]
MEKFFALWVATDIYIAEGREVAPIHGDQDLPPMQAARVALPQSPILLAMFKIHTLFGEAGLLK